MVSQQQRKPGESLATKLFSLAVKPFTSINVCGYSQKGVDNVSVCNENSGGVKVYRGALLDLGGLRRKRKAKVKVTTTGQRILLIKQNNNTLLPLRTDADLNTSSEEFRARSVLFPPLSKPCSLHIKFGAYIDCGVDDLLPVLCSNPLSTVQNKDNVQGFLTLLF